MTTNKVEAYTAVDANENTKQNEDNKGATAVTNTVSLTSMDNNSVKQQRARRSHSPIVKGRSVTGNVKWFSVRKGFGFIRRDDNDEDIFFHGSSIVRQTRAALMLAENQKVEFDVVKGIKGLLEAACVSGPNGDRVGSIVGEGGGFRRGQFRRRIGNSEQGNGERGGSEQQQPKAIANGQQNPKPKRNTNKRGPPPSKNASGGKAHKDEGIESQQSLEDCTIEKEETDPKSGDEDKDSTAEGNN